MSRDNLELLKWGDGSTRLSFWDAIHGDDKIYVLAPDGKAYLSECHQDDDGETLTPVNLVMELRTLAQEWYNTAQEITAWLSVCTVF